MKNYYDILGLSSFEDSQDAILTAYRNGTKRLQQQISEGKDVKSNLVSLNEAYLVLSDKDLKKEYDYCLSTNQDNQDLNTAIDLLQAKAANFIDNRMSQMPKRRKKSKWPAILCGIFLFSAFCTFVTKCYQGIIEFSDVTPESLGSYIPSNDWNIFEIANSFSIAIPNTMELRSEFDEYTILLKEKFHSVNNANAVFQQAQLSQLSTSAYNTYCRVIVTHFSFPPGEAEHYNQTSYITSEDKQILREVVDSELGLYDYVFAPTFQWVDISGTKAIEAKYKRTGDKGPVICRLYLLPNYDEVVKIIISYRESDTNIWKSDLDNIIRTFKWNNPK